MAKNNTTNKIRRGVGSKALTAGGEQQESLEDILGASIKKIIESIEDSTETLESVLQDVVSNKTDTNKVLKDIKTSIDNKMTAMLCALYGRSDASVTSNLQQWTSKLGKADVKKAIWTGLINPINAVENAVRDMADDVIMALMDKQGETSSSNNQPSTDMTALLSSVQSIEAIVRLIQEQKNEDKTIHHDVEINATGLDTVLKDTISELIEKQGEILSSNNQSSADTTALLSSVQSIEAIVRLIQEQKNEDKTIHHDVEINATGLDAALKDAIRSLDSQIDLATMISLGSKSASGGGAFDLMLEMIKKLQAVADEASDASFYIDVINDSLASFNKLDVEPIDRLDDVAKAMVVANVSLIVIAATYKVAIFGMKGLQEEVTVLSNIIQSLEQMPNPGRKAKANIKASKEVISNLAAISGSLSLIAMTAPLAIIGAGLMWVEVKVLSTVIGHLATMEPVDTAYDNIKDLAILVAACSGLLVLAAAVGTFILASIPAILGFTVVLSTFMLGVIGAFNLATRGMKTALQGAQDFGELVAISAAVMLLGGGLFTIFPWLTLGSLAFTVNLAAFMFGVLLTYKAFSAFSDDAAAGAAEFSILVGVSALTLLLGGGLFVLNPWLIATVSLFGVILTAFVGAITYAYSKFAISDAFKGALEFGELIAISAASILAGGLLLYLNPWLIATVTLFGIILIAFVGAVTGVYTKYAEEIKNAIPAAIALSTLIAVSSAAILIGGLIFATKEGMFLASLGFAFVTVAFMGAFVGLINILGDIPIKNLAAGVIAMVAIAVIIDMMSNTFAKVADIANSTNPVKLLFTLALMGAAVYATTYLVGVLAGAIAAGGFWLTAGAIAAAELALMGVAEIISMTASAMKDVAEASNAWASMKVPDTKNVVDSIGAFMTIAGALAPLANPLTLAIMLAARQNVNAMAETIAACGTSVSEFSSLTVPIYDKDGRKIGVRKMSYSDFTDAADNVQAIIETLGNAIIETYNKNPQIFSAGWLGDFLGMQTPFAIVAKSCAAMGSMISDIADGVRDYANFRMPLYDKNGKVIGSRPFDKNDFKSAAENIKEVIMTLGDAIIKTYEAGKPYGMFDDTRKWWMPGISTPFTMVVRSTATLGKLISDIAAGVKDYAALRMPIFDANGKEIGTRQMKPEDFTAAAEGISEVIITLGSAIIAVYNQNKHMFDQAGESSLLKDIIGTDLGDNPFVIVRKSFEGTGKLISEAVQAINDASKIDVDIEAAGKKITEVLKAVVSAVKDTYDAGNGIFDQAGEASILKNLVGTDLGDNPFVIVKKSMMGTSELISEAVKCVNEASKIDVDIPTATSKITGAITAMALAVKGAYDLNPDMYKQSSSIIGDIFGNDLGDNPFVIVKKSLMGTSELITDAAKAIQEVQKIRFDGKIEDKVKFILGVIPKNIKGMIPEDESELESLTSYQEVIKNLLNAYKSVWEVISGINGPENAVSSIDTIGKSINGMIWWAKLSINSLPNDEEMIVKVQSFAASMELYDRAVTNLAEAFNILPEDYTKYDNLHNALTRINTEIDNVPDLTSFKEETETLKSYVKTINSINTQKVDRLTQLADSLTNMSTKLGGLEKLTDVLSNKVAGVLGALADRMDEAGKTIKTADRMQAERHKKIDDAMFALKSLLQQPLSVNVKHIPETAPTTDMTPAGDSDNKTTTKDSTPGNTGGQTTDNSGGGNNGGQEGNLPPTIALPKEQDQTLLVNQVKARLDMYNDWRGGGKQEGAK